MATQRNQILRRVYKNESVVSFDENISPLKNRDAEIEDLEDFEILSGNKNVVDDGAELEMLKQIDERERKVLDRLYDSENELSTPYYRLLGEALMINGTAGKVARATGIPKSSVQQGIKKIRQYLNAK